MTTESTVSPVQKNIQAIIKLEEEAFNTLSRGERVSNAIARFVGQMSFAVYHIIWFGIWALVNSGFVPGIEPIDPFPFTLLTTLVSPGNFSRQADQKPTQRADPFRERNAGVSRSRR